MPDVFTKAKRSEVMSRIRGRGNKETELALMAVFRNLRITGWRRQRRLRVESRRSRVEGRKRAGARPSSLVPRLTVRPDFGFPELKVAVFVDGCFWHGCPQHCNQPANNRAFWRRKLAANKARDQFVTHTLRRAGWRVVRIWEHAPARKNQRRLVASLRRFWSAPA
jgi:DNA mismatch endonuclease (patch repair protein)